MLQKLYPLNGGKITINGLDIAYISTESMRNIVGSVPQQLNLFSGNIIENIAVGDLNPDMQRVMDILKELGLMPFIEKLPEGLTTQVGENGVALSGGEKQRIAIARALYRNPEIILFDEATSSLDSASEQHVKNVLQNLNQEGKTIILIAHRLSTVVDSDVIVVLENGKLIEQGSHVDLYKEGTRYYEMWQKQMV